MREEKLDWKFSVSAGTILRESVFVVGSCPTLGNWSNKFAVKLHKEKAENDERTAIWSVTLGIPKDRNVLFRYFVGIEFEPDEKYPSRQIVVRRWETNQNPRLIKKGAISNVQENVEPHEFGVYDNCKLIDKGWLTSETVIQFKLFGESIQFWKRKLEGKKVYMKLTPLSLTKGSSGIHNVPQSDIFDESMDTQDVAEQPDRWPITEIAVMNVDEFEFHLQEQFGRPLSIGECIIFSVSVHFPEAVGYMMDYFVYSTRVPENSPPIHIGFSYILPSMLTSSEGKGVVPITSNNHRPIGQLNFDYLVVRPILGFECDMSESYSRIWKKTWHGLDVGHRGLGISYKLKVSECSEVRENTIASLKNAASAGADLVEFDVQLSKDLVPVLYHDFHVCIAMKKRKKHALADTDVLELPLKDLTLEQLQQLKIYDMEEWKHRQVYSDDDLEEHQPFPTLRQALETLDPHVGFNVEIKWTMQLKDGTFELYHPFDLNMYLDVVIKVVLLHSRSRKIVFSCFHPDICTMIRLKQNKYPVIFLTQGVTKKYPDYRDPRTQSIPMAIYFANSAEILGINVHTEDILRDTTQVKMVLDAGLVIFCWGDDNNNPDTIKHLKKLGIHGVIYDKIDVYSSKEVKESIFLAEARMRDALRKTAAENASQSTALFTQSFQLNNMEEVRKNLASVATSSTQSPWAHRDESAIGEGDTKAS